MSLEISMDKKDTNNIADTVKEQNSSGLLAHELKLRQKKNKNYTLRAFARDLEVSPSYISLVINGKKYLSINRAYIFSQKLKLSDIASQRFLESVAKENGIKGSAKEILNPIMNQNNSYRNIPEYEAVRADQLECLRNWHHIAILELTTCDNFQSNIVWIARRLKISQADACDSIEILLRLGLLKIVNGRWTKTKRRLAVSTAKSLSAVREFHKQTSVKAIECMNSRTSESDFEKRRIIGATMAVNPEKIQEIKKKLTLFLSTMLELAIEGSCTEVYQLNLQFFPLTTDDENSKGEVK